MIRFLKTHWESLLFTIILLVTGIFSMFIDLRITYPYFTYLIGGLFIYFAVKSFFLANYAQEKANKIVYYINIPVDIALAVYLMFFIKEPSFRLIAGLGFILPIVRSFIAKSWIGQLYLDRSKIFMLIIMFIFSPSNIGTNYGMLIALGVVCFIVVAIMIYYLAMYGNIISEEKEDD